MELEFYRHARRKILVLKLGALRREERRARTKANQIEAQLHQARQVQMRLQERRERIAGEIQQLSREN